MTTLNRTLWFGGSVGVAALLIAGWQLIANYSGIPPVFLPGPDRAWNALVTGFWRRTRRADLGHGAAHALRLAARLAVRHCCRRADRQFAPRPRVYSADAGAGAPCAGLGLHADRHGVPRPVRLHGDGGDLHRRDLARVARDHLWRVECRAAADRGEPQLALRAASRDCGSSRCRMHRSISLPACGLARPCR